MSLSLNIPVIETERLILRAPQDSDFETEVAFYQSERSTFVGGPMPRGQTWRSYAMLIGHWALRGFGFWAVEEKASGEYCGRVGLWYPEGWPEAEIGWTMMDHAEGRGIAYEAAIASRRYAYETLGWPTAISLIAPENARSRVLAERLGARHDSDFHHETYGLTQVWRHPDPHSLKGAS